MMYYFNRRVVQLSICTKVLIVSLVLLGQGLQARITRNPTTNPLEQMIQVLILTPESPIAWGKFDAIQGIAWDDKQPVAGQKLDNGQKHFVKRGHFSINTLSDTQALTTRDINAGGAPRNSFGWDDAFTLSGDHAGVRQLWLTRSYVTTNYVAILKKELGRNKGIKVIASDCKDSTHLLNDNAVFFRITLYKNSAVFVQIATRGKNNKDNGNTTIFVFYQVEPRDIIAQANCTN